MGVVTRLRSGRPGIRFSIFAREETFYSGAQKTGSMVPLAVDFGAFPLRQIGHLVTNLRIYGAKPPLSQMTRCRILI